MDGWMWKGESRTQRCRFDFEMRNERREVGIECLFCRTQNVPYKSNGKTDIMMW